MLRLVLDTNVLISAFGWKGPSNQIFQKIVDGEFELAISKRQLEELERVLSYHRLKFTDDQKERFLAIVCEVAAVVETSGAINVIKEDPDDNVILESAIVAGANFIVSGDPDLLNLKEFNGIKIVKPREFVEIFNKKP